MWPTILLKKLSNDKKPVYIGGGNIFAYNLELLRYSNHSPHVIYKKQCKLEEKVDNDKEIKIAHKVHHAGKKMIFSMVATNQNSQIKTVKIIWQVEKKDLRKSASHL